MQVAEALQVVLRPGKVGRPVQFQFQPAVAVAAGEAFAQRQRFRDVLLQTACEVRLQKADVSVETGTREGMDVPYTGRIDARIVHHSRIGIPVSVHIHGFHRTCSARRIIADAVADGVVCGGEIGKGHQRLCMALPEGVVEESETVGEGRFQPGVAHGNVLRVGIVGDIEQLAHRRLCRRPLVIDAQVALLAETVTEVERRAPVHHRPCRVDVYTEIILPIGGTLGLQHHAHVHLPLAADHAQHHLHVVCVGAVFRIAAQTAVQVTVHRLCQQTEIAVPRAVSRMHTAECRCGQCREIVGVTVALRETVLELIAELQVGLPGYRLAVSRLHGIIPALRRHEVEPVRPVGGIIAECVPQLEILEVLCRESPGVGIRIVAVHAQRHVPSLFPQPAVHLQHRPQRGVVAVGDGRILLAVHHQSPGFELCDGRCRQGIVDDLVRIGAVGSRRADSLSVVLADLYVRAEHDVPDRIGPPLQTEPPVPRVGPGVLL